MSQKYSIAVEGKDKKEELSLDPANKLAVGDTVTLKDGKKAKVKSVTLNVSTGAYDVELEKAQDANQPRVIDAEGNDQHPESKAVKDVVNDPRFTPAVTDPNRPAAENAAISAGASGAFQTGALPPAKSSDAPEKGDKAKLQPTHGSMARHAESHRSEVSST